MVLASLVQLIRIVLDETPDSDSMREKCIQYLATPGTAAEDAVRRRQ